MLAVARQYEAVAKESQPSPATLPFDIGIGRESDIISLSILTKPYVLHKYRKKGLISIVAKTPIGKHGCNRYHISISRSKTDILRKIYKHECTPFSIGYDGSMDAVSIIHMSTVVKEWCSKILNTKVDSVTTESYKTPETILFYPCVEGDYVYVTPRERMMLIIDLSLYKGTIALSSHNLIIPAIDEMDIPGSRMIQGLYVYDIETSEILDDLDQQHTIMNLNGIISSLDRAGDVIIPLTYERIDLIKELCKVWDVDTDTDISGYLYIYGAKHLPIDLIGSVREILLDHPPMARITKKEYSSYDHNNRYLTEYKGEIVELPGDIMSVPAWSIQQLKGTETVRDTYPQIPLPSLFADSAGITAVFESEGDDDMCLSRDLITLRTPTDNNDLLTRLEQLTSTAWSKAIFHTKWGIYMWLQHSIKSIHYMKPSYRFDTIEDAIAALENI